MTESPKIIGIDIGASTGRCIVAEFSGNNFILNEVSRFNTPSYQNSDGLFWNVDQIFEEIVSGLKKSVELYGPEFLSIGVDTWGVDYVLLDSDGSKLRDPYHYRDSRTDASMQKALEKISKRDLYFLTGTQIQQYNTVFQLYAESEDILNRSHKLLHIPDYINFLFSGKDLSEYSIASTSGITDPVSRRWNNEIMQKLDLPEHILHNLVEPGYKLGTVSESIARMTGLSRNTSIIASCGHDTASAVASVPARDKNWAYLSSGTWSLLGIESRKPIISEEGFDANFTNEGGAYGTTRFLKNIIGLWPVQECKKFWNEKGHELSYSELTKKAEDLGSIGKTIDLNDSSFLKPGNMPEKIQDSLRKSGQAEADSDAEIIRIILENLANNYRSAIKEIEIITNTEVEILHAVGGGIKNGLLNQLTADACGINVYAGPVEGTVIGNIGIQAICHGIVRDINEWRDLVNKSFEVKTYAPCG